MAGAGGARVLVFTSRSTRRPLAPRRRRRLLPRSGLLIGVSIAMETGIEAGASLTAPPQRSISRRRASPASSGAAGKPFAFLRRFVVGFYSRVPRTSLLADLPARSSTPWSRCSRPLAARSLGLRSIRVFFPFVALQRHVPISRASTAGAPGGLLRLNERRRSSRAASTLASDLVLPQPPCFTGGLECVTDGKSGSSGPSAWPSRLRPTAPSSTTRRARLERHRQLGAGHRQRELPAIQFRRGNLGDVGRLAVLGTDRLGCGNRFVAAPTLYLGLSYRTTATISARLYLQFFTDGAWGSLRQLQRRCRRRSWQPGRRCSARSACRGSRRLRVWVDFIPQEFATRSSSLRSTGSTSAPALGLFLDDFEAEGGSACRWSSATGLAPDVADR